MGSEVVLASHFSGLIATNLASLWSKARLPAFRDYVQKMYGIETDGLPQFRCIYIGETEEGDATRRPKPGLIKQWWQADDHGVREVELPKVDSGADESPFFSTPVILFYQQDGQIAVAERLGQRMVCWKSGRVLTAQNSVEIVDLQQLTDT